MVQQQVLGSGVFLMLYALDCMLNGYDDSLFEAQAIKWTDTYLEMYPTP